MASGTWDNIGVIDTGAVTWGSGLTGITGEIDAINSRIGNSTNSDLQDIVVDNVNGAYFSRFLHDAGGSIYVNTQFVDFDFGDAPASYYTLYADNGATHYPTGPRLGSTRDSESEGIPSADALGDGSDEDGVVFYDLIHNSLAMIEVHVEQTSEPVRLDAWIDFNQDGDWEDAGEQIFTSSDVTLGINQLSFDIPGTAISGDTYARFRLSTQGGLSSNGLANDGEVEDYQITIMQTLEVDLPSGNGTDDVTVRLNSGNVEVYDNNGSSVIASKPLTHTHAIILNGAAAEDNKVMVDYQSGGFFRLLGGIEFNGGTSGTDELIIQGTGVTVSGYLSSETSLGNASVMTSEGGQGNLVAFSNVEPLSALGKLTFTADGSVYAGTNSLTVDSTSQLGLDSLTTLAGGIINSDSGVSLGSGQLISGYGEINGPIASGFGSTVNLTGNLTLGDANAVDGFTSDGRLLVGENTATIHDANEAVLGSLTTLGTGGADGTLNAPNGSFLEEGKNLQGRGTVDGDFHNDGHVISTDNITFNGEVTGIGDFPGTGTVNFNGGTSFGHSPTETEINGNANFGSSNTHIVELGGKNPGSEFDQFNSTGTINIGGTLDVQLIDSFSPQAGDSFEIMNAANGISGTFDTQILPAVPTILEWHLVTESNTITLTITYSASMIAMFDMALVTTPTTTEPDGSVVSVPASMTEIHEWQGYFIEVYAQVPAGVQEELSDVEFTLNYDPAELSLDLANIEGGAGLETFDHSGPAGQLTISGTLDGSHPNLGIGSPFLVARIPANSDVMANVSGQYPDASNTTLPTMSNSQVDIDQFTTPVDGADAAAASTTVKAVRFDLNDNDKVDLADLLMLISTFGQTTTNEDSAYRADFDESGNVGLSDLLKMINHFGYSEGDGNEIEFPNTTPIVPEPESLNFRLEGQPTADEYFVTHLVGQAVPDVANANSTTTPLLEAEPIRSLNNTPVELEPLKNFDELDALWSAEYELLTDDVQLLELAAASENTSGTLASKQDQDDVADDLFAAWGV